MRKSQGIEIQESIFTDGDSVTTQTFSDGKRYRRCMIVSWLMSNIITFTVGYYVKAKYFKDKCLVNDEGSM